MTRTEAAILEHAEVHEVIVEMDPGEDAIESYLRGHADRYPTCSWRMSKWGDLAPCTVCGRASTETLEFSEADHERRCAEHSEDWFAAPLQGEAG